MPSLLPVAFFVGPAVVAAVVLLSVRPHLRATLPPRYVRFVTVAWAVGVVCLLVGPLLTLYSLWTSVGDLAAPAPGLVGFDVARWLLSLGGGAFLAGVVGYAVGRRRRRRDGPG